MVGWLVASNHPLKILKSVIVRLAAKGTEFVFISIHDL